MTNWSDGLPAQGEMCGRGEGAAGDLCEEFGCGPDTDSGHAAQDCVKRVSKNPLFYLNGHLVSLLTLCNELECQAWQNNDSGIRAGNDTVCSVSAMVISAARRFPRRGASLQSWVAIFS